MFDKLYKYLVRDIIEKNKKYIAFSSILFVVAIISGIIKASDGHMPMLMQEVVENFLRMAESPASSLQIAISIFFNNIKSVFFAVVFGCFLGIVPIVSIWSNGQIIGMIAKYVQVNLGIPIFKTFLSLFPHCILEFPAFIICVSVTLKTGLIMIMCLFRKQSWNVFFNSFMESLIIMVLIVLPLFLIAALMEGFISPIILGLLIR